MQPWCVQWKSGKYTGWCATFRNSKPSKDAVSDKTACGYFVTLRIGSERRRPTCKDCKARLARRKTNA